MTRIALAQLASSADRDHNRKRCLDALDEAAERGAELVVFPEVVLDRFFPATVCPRPGAAAHLAERIPGPTTELLAAKAREHGIVVVFNLYEDGGDGHYYDASPVIDADGTLLGVTRMMHICDYEGFHERGYYHPGDGPRVYDTRIGKLGVAICYDRHYPEYMRALGLSGAELVVIPQAGAVGEWPEGLFEAEVRAAAFQNGYFAALANRVGVEDRMTFAGESFVVDPAGRVVARGAALEEDLVVADVDLAECAESSARRHFLRDRRGGDLVAALASLQPPAEDQRP